MAKKNGHVRKYKSTSGPKAASSSAMSAGNSGDSPQPDGQIETADLKAEILTSLIKDITVLLRSVLAEEFEAVKSELPAAKTEVSK